jgi:hypothetical protein
MNVWYDWPFTFVGCWKNSGQWLSGELLAVRLSGLTHLGRLEEARSIPGFDAMRSDWLCWTWRIPHS